MNLIRKLRRWSSLFLLVVFFEFSGFPVHASISEQYKEIREEIEFSQIIQACPSEYMVTPIVERVHIPVLSIVKTSCDNPSFNNPGISKISLTLFRGCTHLSKADPSDRLDKICKLQI
jgi:hypothetical protein